MFLRRHARLHRQEGQLVGDVEYLHPPKLPPGGKRPAQRSTVNRSNDAASSKRRAYYISGPRTGAAAGRRGVGAARAGFCTGVPSKAFPPEGQEQLPKGEARSAQPLPDRPCQPPEKPAPAYQNTPPPVLPARVRQAGGEGDRGGGRWSFPRQEDTFSIARSIMLDF